MRLLKIGNRRELSLTDDLLEDIPPYAILSHTWGPDKEEVTFKDITDGSGRDKAGYVKINFCANQARQHELGFIWVDTACIDKTNQVELSEAIVSMYRWYANATKCYVFLSDVSGCKRDSARNVQQWEPALRKSRWFTRGWTLQELLAPQVVEFYSREGVRLGDKQSLEHIIFEVTGIPETVLCGGCLFDVDPVERMRWASKRETKRVEDRAYCLLGIFDVSMPVIYGEGERAFDRLKDEIARSYRRQLEAFDRDCSVPQSCGAETQSSKTASQETEEALLERRASLLRSLSFLQMDSRRTTIGNAYSSTCEWLLRHPAYLEWIDPQERDHHYRILWMNGKPGTGKSTLVKFALVEASKTNLGAEILVSFFFNARGHDLEKSITGMYRALLFQLLTQVTWLQELLDDAKYHSDDRTGAYEWTIDNLCELLSSAIAKLKWRRLRCFIDALDEGDEEQIREMVDFFENLGQVALKNGSKLFICFASRHYPTIEVRSGRQLTLENERGHTEDLSKYIRHHLRAGKGEYIEQIKTEVQKKANGVFLWAVLVVKILNDEFRRGRIPAVKKRLQEIPPRLSELFKDLLRRDHTNMDDLLLCLQWILFAKRPLTLKEFYFAMWAGLEPESEDLAAWDSSHITVDDMENFLVNSSKGLVELTKSKVPTVEFIHESVRDFLLKENGLREIWPELGDDLYSLGHDRLKRCCQTYMTVDTSRYKTHGLEALRASSAAFEKPQGHPAIDFPADNRSQSWHDTIRDPECEYGVFPRFLGEPASPQPMFGAYFPRDPGVEDDELVFPETPSDDTPPLTASKSEQLFEGKFPFLHYATTNVLHHANEAATGLLQEEFLASFPLSTLISVVAQLENNSSNRYTANASLLYVLADQNCFRLIRTICHEGSHMGVRGERHVYPICAAMKNGHREAVRALLDPTGEHQVPEIEGSLYFTLPPKEDVPLWEWALLQHHEVIAEILMQSGHFSALPSPTRYQKAISFAIRQGYETITKLLFNLPEVQSANKHFFNKALLDAVEAGSAKIIRLLLDERANIAFRDSNGDTALLRAARLGYTSIIQLLLTNGADIEARDRDNDTALLRAARQGDDSVIQVLLANGANIEARNISKHTSLTLAAHQGQQSTVHLLMERGANIKATDDEGKSALIHAASKGELNIVSRLLKRNAKIEAVDNKGMTALMHAASEGESYIVSLLLDNNANLEASDKKGMTALMHAASKNMPFTVSLLLKHGANFKATDNTGKTVLDLKKEYCWRTAELLHRYSSR